MNKKLQGKVAIVTGGASGIGEATVRLFAAHDARAVVIADIQDELGRSVADSIGTDICSYFHCDVRDEEQVEEWAAEVKALVDWTAKTYGRLDVMFSNAGIGSNSNQSILNLDLSILDEVMRINARGMATCVKHAARKMVELGTRGVIICTASNAVEMGAPEMVDYGMSKHAIVGLMRSAFQNLGEYGIRINCVSPAGIPTPLTGKIGMTAEDIGKIMGRIQSLKGVVLTVEHVAEAVLYLASDAATFVTGRNMVLDGGITVWHD